MLTLAFLTDAIQRLCVLAGSLSTSYPKKMSNFPASDDMGAAPYSYEIIELELDGQSRIHQPSVFAQIHLGVCSPRGTQHKFALVI